MLLSDRPSESISMTRIERFTFMIERKRSKNVLLSLVRHKSSSATCDNSEFEFVDLVHSTKSKACSSSPAGKLKRVERLNINE